jgi:hypothetical protein
MMVSLVVIAGRIAIPAGDEGDLRARAGRAHHDLSRRGLASAARTGFAGHIAQRFSGGVSIS